MNEIRMYEPQVPGGPKELNDDLERIYKALIAQGYSPSSASAMAWAQVKKKWYKDKDGKWKKRKKKEERGIAMSTENMPERMAEEFKAKYDDLVGKGYSHGVATITAQHDVEKRWETFEVLDGELGDETGERFWMLKETREAKVLRVDVTPNLIRVRVRNPGDFKKSTFKVYTNPALKKKGISQVGGWLKGQTTMTTQAWLFDKKKWTKARAIAWVKKH